MFKSSSKALAAFALLFVIVATQGCFDRYHDREDNTITGSNHLVSETRSVPDFDGIRILNQANVSVTQDERESVRIEVNENVADRVVARVVNGVLEVGFDDGSYHEVTLNVSVSLPLLHSVEIDGSGTIATLNRITTDRLTSSIKGAGNISISGTANNHTAMIIGSGNLLTYGLETENTTVTISGSGNAEITVTGTLDAVIEGVGSIEYAGNPETVHRTISGVGSISPR